MRKVELKDPNQNPWYILMTLHGEQEGDGVNGKLHENNRNLWNAWACQGMPLEKRQAIAAIIRVDLEATVWTDVVAKEVAARFRKEWCRRNGPSDIVPEIPHPSKMAQMDRLHFKHRLLAKQMVFHTSFFQGSHFERGAEFASTYFSQLAHFNWVVFDVAANFEGANFNADLIVLNATFHCSANFLSARMERNANFDGTSFLNPLFSAMQNFNELRLLKKDLFQTGAHSEDAYSRV